MSKIVTSNCEREFIYKNILQGSRLDGRRVFDGRDVMIAFGKEDGNCIVVQGNTRVLSVVTSEITSPKPSRPAEGVLFINLDLSPMAAPNLRTGRMSDSTVEASRQLERCIRDSKCIDLESLCVVSGLKVWCIRVNLQVLNNDGNFIECASIACIAALAHFKRPDVTVVGTDVTLHSTEDRNPVPLCLHHMPVIVNLAVFDEGTVILVDPLEMEERMAPGRVILGINAHQEICSWHLSGILALSKETTLQCMSIAVKRAQVSTQIIRAALDDDKYSKSTKKQTGFVSLMRTGTILGAKHSIPHAFVQIQNEAIDVTEDFQMSDDNEVEEGEIDTKVTEAVASRPLKHKARALFRKAQAAVFEGGENRWQLDENYSKDESNESEVEEEEEEVKPIIKKEKDDQVITLDDSDDSEEDQKHFLKSHQVDIADKKSSSVRGWYSKDAFLK